MNLSLMTLTRAGGQPFGFTLLAFYFGFNVYQWQWPGVPLSRMVECMVGVPKEDQNILLFVDRQICGMPLVEALTSPYSYIRECRRWFEDAKKRGVHLVHEYPGHPARNWPGDA